MDSSQDKKLGIKSTQLDMEATIKKLQEKNPKNKEMMDLLDDLVAEMELNPARPNKNYFDHFLANRHK